MNQTAKRSPSGAKILVFAAVAGAVLFGAYLAYLAWSNDSFPVQQRPFGDYATVVSSRFNGTEYSFEIQWLSPQYLPRFAQLTSPASDAANTPVCGTGLIAVAAGQRISMPFTITPLAAALTNVDLSVAVQTVATGSEFTIVYNIPSVSAQPGDMTPLGIACQQPAGVM